MRHPWMMTNRLVAVTLVLTTVIMPIGAKVTLVKELPDCAQFVVDGGLLRIQFWLEDVARVTYVASTELPQLGSLSVVAQPAAIRWRRIEDDKAIYVVGPQMKVRIDRQTGTVSILDLDNHVLLSESVSGRRIEPATQAGVNGTSCTQCFDLAQDEGIYGLGQHQRGVWNYNLGVTIRLAQANTEVAIPVITSSKGYILLWDNPAVTTVSIGAIDQSEPNRYIMRWSSEWGKAIDYYFCYSDGTIASAMRAYRRLTGNAPLMPRWLFGFWQCKERYASQEELLGVARKYRQLKVPIDGIIQDWQYWPEGNNTWGSHQFDPARYPDPEGMFRELRQMNYHTLISVWPKFDLGSANSDELNAAGAMYPQITRYVFPPGQGQWYDPFNPKGRQIFWRQLRDQLFSKGVDGWWLDAPEPEINAREWRTYQTGMGPGYQVFNAYPLMHSTGIYQGQRSTTEDKRVVILTRSAYAGQQRNSAITWSGDIQGTWQVFRNQIPAGLHFSLSGIPYWNTDTGGFFGNRSTGNGDPCNPQYRELFARWFQFSTFCPMFRVHGAYGLKPGKEFYRFDEKTQSILRTYLDLRYRLLPYIYSVAWDVTANGSTFMRPLVIDFPKDKQALGIGDQYLFGPSILVKPVTTAGAVTSAVYLPDERGPWHDFWSGQVYKEGQRIDTATPLETLPIFIKAGSILPLGPFLQYSNEKPADPIELRIYTGASGQFILYEDEGDSYRYEKGSFATIPFEWDEAGKTLTIGKRTGSFTGMLKQRVFNVVLVRKGHGTGIEDTQRPDKVVRYDGDIVKLRLP